MEGRGCDLIKVQSRQFSGGTEENHNKSQDGLCSSGDSNWATPVCVYSVAVPPVFSL